MYIRYCGPKKRWEDSLKTCIGDNNVTTSTPAPAQNDGGPGMGGSAGRDSSSMDLLNRLIGANPCQDGELFDPNSGLCVPNNFENGDASSRDLLKAILSSSPCTGNEVFNPSTGECIDISELVTMTDEVVKILCPDGFKWNALTAVCEKVSPVSSIASSITPAVWPTDSCVSHMLLFYCYYSMRLSETRACFWTRITDLFVRVVIYGILLSALVWKLYMSKI